MTRARSVAGLGVAVATIALGVAGACTFPDVEIGPGQGGAGATSATTLSGTTTGVTSSTTSSSTTTSTSSGGGPPSSSTGGGSSSTEGGGQGGLGGQGGGSGGEAPSSSGGGDGGSGGGGGCGDCDPDLDADGDCDRDRDPNGLDCQPCDDRVYHGQAEYFEDPYLDVSGRDSFDYNCESGAEHQYNYVPDGCQSIDGADCPEIAPIYVGTAPICGVTATLQYCVATSIVVGVGATCEQEGPPTSPRAACR